MTRRLVKMINMAVKVNDRAKILKLYLRLSEDWQSSCYYFLAGFLGGKYIPKPTQVVIPKSRREKIALRNLRRNKEEQEVDTTL